MSNTAAIPPLLNARDALSMLIALMSEINWYDNRALPPVTIRRTSAAESGLQPSSSAPNKLHIFLDSLASVSVSLAKKEVLAIGLRSTSATHPDVVTGSEKIELLIAENEGLTHDSPSVMQLERVWQKLKDIDSIFQREVKGRGGPSKGPKALEALLNAKGGFQTFQELKFLVYSYTLPKHSTRINKRLELFALFVSALGEVSDMLRKTQPTSAGTTLNDLPDEEDIRVLNEIHKNLCNRFRNEDNIQGDLSWMDDIHYQIDLWGPEKLEKWSALINISRLRHLPARRGEDKDKFFVRLYIFQPSDISTPSLKIFKGSVGFPLKRYFDKVKVINAHINALVSAIMAPEVNLVMSSEVSMVPLARDSKPVTIPDCGNTDVTWNLLWNVIRRYNSGVRPDGEVLSVRMPRSRGQPRMSQLQAMKTTDYLKDIAKRISSSFGPGQINGLVHCEVKILDKVLPYFQPSDNIFYAGVSKLSCGGCTAVVKEFENVIKTRGSHGRYYFPYAVPNSFKDDRVWSIFNHILTDFNRRISYIRAGDQPENKAYSESSSPSSDEETRTLVALARRVRS